MNDGKEVSDNGRMNRDYAHVIEYRRWLVKFIVRRKLKDYDSWKKLVSEMDGVRREHGSRGVTVHRNAKDPNEAYLIFEWDDQKPYQGYFNRPDVQKALAETGTTEVIEISESFSLAE